MDNSGKWFLTPGEIVDRIRQAKLDTNVTEVLRLIDSGVLPHYRSETRQRTRKVPIEAVDQLIESRRKQLAASGWVA